MLSRRLAAIRILYSTTKFMLTVRTKHVAVAFLLFSRIKDKTGKYSENLLHLNNTLIAGFQMLLPQEFYFHQFHCCLSCCMIVTGYQPCKLVNSLVNYSCFWKVFWSILWFNCTYLPVTFLCKLVEPFSLFGVGYVGLSQLYVHWVGTPK